MIKTLEGIDTILCAKIGDCPKDDLAKAGITAIQDYAYEYIETAVSAVYRARMGLPVEAAARPAISADAPMTAGRILQVGARSANVRSGPDTDCDVVSRLTRGESVLVVAEGDGPDGWSLIRIEGDGVEGYIATRLLSE